MGADRPGSEDPGQTAGLKTRPTRALPFSNLAPERRLCCYTERPPEILSRSTVLERTVAWTDAFSLMGMPVRHSAILRTGVLLIGVPIVFQLASLAYLLKVQTVTSNAEGLELHSKEVITRTAELELALNQAHAAVRALGIYQTLEFEKDRRAALSRWPVMLANLRRLVADNPGQQAQLELVRQAAQPYLQWAAEMDRMAASGQWQNYRAELLTARGKTLLDTIEARLAAFRDEEQRLDALRLQNVATSRQRERTVLVAIAALALAITIGLLLMFTRGFSVRLGRISVNGRRLATGERLLDPLPGSDELSALDAVLHDSAHRLAAAAEAEKRYSAALEERGRALEQANKDLLFRTQENEMFVYSVSHDLRSPLVNVQGFTKELTQACGDLHQAIGRAQIDDADRRRLDTIVNTDIGEAISFIQTAVTRLSAIVDALLRLSRAGRVEFTPQRVDLGQTVDRIVRAMRGTIEERHAEVQVGALPAVLGDPVAVEQVFANLIGNALNYADPRRAGRVEVGMSADGIAAERGQVVVFVRDNGLGIPSRYLSKLFMPFERLHGDRVKGEGIGLALARRIVDRHGGRIWAESTEHVGTTFFVALPRADGVAGRQAEAVTSA